MLKKSLAMFLAVCFVFVSVCVISVSAYSTPYTTQIKANDYADRIYFSGKFYYNIDKYGTVQNYSVTASSGTASNANGAMRLYNKSATANTFWGPAGIGSTSAGDNLGSFCSTTRGMTIDLYAKFVDIPKIAVTGAMTDTGVVSGNPSNIFFSGIHIDFCSSEKYMVDPTKANNEMSAILVRYDNSTLGTDAALILPYGNRNSIATASAVTYFFNLPTDYARYTLTFDPVNKTTNFYINGVAQKYNGTNNTTFPAVALCYRATAYSNMLRINLNNAQTAVKGNASTYKSDIYIDEMDIYPCAYTPTATLGAFEDDVAGEGPDPTPQNAKLDKAYLLYQDFQAEAATFFDPIFWNAFVEWMEYGFDLVENGTQEELDAHCNTGFGADWFTNRMTWASTAGANATTGGSAVTINGTKTVLPANTPILLGTDRIWISHATYLGDSTDALAWDNATVILTREGMKLSEYKAFGNSSYKLTTNKWHAYVCAPTAVDGYYEIMESGTTTDRTVPKGGFIVCVSKEGIANGSVPSSVYASELFGNRNERALSVSGLEAGDYVKLENVYLSPDGIATLQTSGAWRCYRDPVIGSTKYMWTSLKRTNMVREHYKNFSTASYMIEVDELPATGERMSVSVKGNGSVQGTVDGVVIEDLSEFLTKEGSIVVLTAQGEGFKYWLGGNDAIVSTSATLEISGGKAKTFCAVFEDQAQEDLVNVYFKDSRIGKIWAVKTVERGGLLVTSDVEATLKGYVFGGWSLPEGTVIEGTTEVYTKYVRDLEDLATVTVTDRKTFTYVRPYGSLMALEAAGDNFSYWTLDGKKISGKRNFTFSSPARDCALVAVYGEGSTSGVLATSVDLAQKEDDIYYLLARDAAPGYTITETGVLMTRKATASDLVLSSTLPTVTRGVSTAPDSMDVVGFIKDVAGKSGTWIVRGYVTYTTLGGMSGTVYGIPMTITVE